MAKKFITLGPGLLNAMFSPFSCLLVFDVRNNFSGEVALPFICPFYTFSLILILDGYNMQICVVWTIMENLLIACPIVFFFFFFFFFDSVLRPFQDYFSSFETGQSVGGAKTREPQEKSPCTPRGRTWPVSHVAKAGSNPHQTQG